MKDCSTDWCSQHVLTESLLREIIYLFFSDFCLSVVIAACSFAEQVYEKDRCMISLDQDSILIIGDHQSLKPSFLRVLLCLLTSPLILLFVC